MKSATDVQVITTMQVYGGRFVQALAEAARWAEVENLAKLKATWPEYWLKYSQMAEVNSLADGEREANAKLIASAPELLSALIQLAECSPCQNSCAPDDMTCASNRARVAIERATKGTP